MTKSHDMAVSLNLVRCSWALINSRLTMALANLGDSAPSRSSDTRAWRKPADDNGSSRKSNRRCSSSRHFPIRAFGQITHTFSRPFFDLDSSSAQIKPASMVFPVPTSSAINSRWSGDSNIFLTGRN